jgi:hypothetical protein
VFHNDGALTTCPLIALFGASNELPEGKELEALFDRFLLRFRRRVLARRVEKPVPQRAIVRSRLRRCVPEHLGAVV